MGQLTDGGKFLSQTGLKELIKLIKNADDTKLEGIKIGSTEITPVDHKVTLPNAVAYKSDEEPGSAGLLSAKDKKAIDEMTAGSINTIQVDGVDLAKTSGIVNIPLAEAGANAKDGAMSAEDKDKLNKIEDEAQVNIIEEIDIDSTKLTVTDKKVNIPLATQSVNGAMSSADKVKLDSALQGVKLNGSELSKGSDNKVDVVIKKNGTAVTLTNSAVDIIVPIETVKQNGTALVPDANHAVDIVADENVIEEIYIGSVKQTPDGNKKVTLSEATTTAAGVMSAADKAKLDTIEEDADVNVVEGAKLNNTTLEIDGNKNILITAETSIPEDNTKDAAIATIGAIKTYTDTHAKIEHIQQNGVELTIEDKTVDVTVPFMTLYQTIDGTTETQITPDGNHKGVVNLSGLVPKTDIADDFSQAITDTNKVAQAKAIKEYVDSKAHLAFEILSTDSTKDIYYSKDASGNITIHVKDGVTPSTSTIYLVPESGTSGSYIEYFYDAKTEIFEPFGRTDIDLSTYVKYTDVTSFSAEEIDAMWNNPV